MEFARSLLRVCSRKLLENEVLIRMVKGTAKWKQASVSFDLIISVLMTILILILILILFLRCQLSIIILVVIIGETTTADDGTAEEEVAG